MVPQVPPADADVIGQIGNLVSVDVSIILLQLSLLILKDHGVNRVASWYLQNKLRATLTRTMARAIDLSRSIEVMCAEIPRPALSPVDKHLASVISKFRGHRVVDHFDFSV